MEIVAGKVVVVTGASSGLGAPPSAMEKRITALRREPVTIWCASRR
jgi:NADP-dependent 3-hydroxy acid dehydrogenase YdfG